MKKQLKEKQNKEPNYLYFRSLGLILATIFMFIGYLLANKNFNNITEVHEREYIKDLNKYDTTIKIYSKSEDKAKKALSEIEKIYDEYFKLSDRYNTDSELYILNNKKYSDDIININPKLYNMIKYGKELYEVTDGKININNGKLVELWNKNINSNDYPTDSSVKEISMDIDDIVLKDKNKIENNGKLSINLDTFKNNYINDKVIEYLKKNNINSYIITSGSNIYTGDYYQGMGNYVVEVKSPIKGDKPLTMVKLSNKKLSALSTFENYLDNNTRNYVLDNTTRYPVYKMIGINVICSSNIDCELEANKLFMMSIEDGRKYVDDNDDIEALWVYRNERRQIATKSSNHFYD